MSLIGRYCMPTHLILRVVVIILDFPSLINSKNGQKWEKWAKNGKNDNQWKWNPIEIKVESCYSDQYVQRLIYIHLYMMTVIQLLKLHFMIYIVHLILSYFPICHLNKSSGVSLFVTIGAIVSCMCNWVTAAQCVHIQSVLPLLSCYLIFIFDALFWWSECRAKPICGFPDTLINIGKCRFFRQRNFIYFFLQNNDEWQNGK